MDGDDKAGSQSASSPFHLYHMAVATENQFNKQDLLKGFKSNIKDGINMKHLFGEIPQLRTCNISVMIFNSAYNAYTKRKAAAPLSLCNSPSSALFPPDFPHLVAGAPYRPFQFVIGDRAVIRNGGRSAVQIDSGCHAVQLIEGVGDASGTVGAVHPDDLHPAFSHRTVPQEFSLPLYLDLHAATATATLSSEMLQGALERVNQYHSDQDQDQ